MVIPYARVNEMHFNAVYITGTMTCRGISPPVKISTIHKNVLSNKNEIKSLKYDNNNKCISMTNFSSEMPKFAWNYFSNRRCMFICIANWVHFLTYFFSKSDEVLLMQRKYKQELQVHKHVRRHSWHTRSGCNLCRRSRCAKLPTFSSIDILLFSFFSATLFWRLEENHLLETMQICIRADSMFSKLYHFNADLYPCIVE